jgi:hypothetical protein
MNEPEIEKKYITPQEAWQLIFQFDENKNNEKMRISAIEEIKFQLKLINSLTIKANVRKKVTSCLLAKWRDIADARLQLISKDKVTAEPFTHIDRLLHEYDIVEAKKEITTPRKIKYSKPKEHAAEHKDDATDEHATHVPVKLTEGGEINGMELPAGIIVDVPAEDVESIVASGKAEEVPAKKS